MIITVAFNAFVWIRKTICKADILAMFAIVVEGRAVTILPD